MSTSPARKRSFKKWLQYQAVDVSTLSAAQLATASLSANVRETAARFRV